MAFKVLLKDKRKELITAESYTNKEGFTLFYVESKVVARFQTGEVIGIVELPDEDSLSDEESSGSLLEGMSIEAQRAIYTTALRELDRQEERANGKSIAKK